MALKNHTAAEVVTSQIKTGYSRIPYEAHYRIGTVYRALWDFDGSFSPDESYTLDMIQTIKAAVRETLPGFPIEMPLFFGEKYFDNGVIDGVFWDSGAISAEEFADIINTIG